MDLGFPDLLNRSTTADDWWRQVASQLAVPGITRGWATYRACRAMVASTQPCQFSPTSPRCNPTRIIVAASAPNAGAQHHRTLP
ncbi:conserved hypothetical protein [Mycobacterium tuberculosis T17]|nr:conserved hypothetical protein [Mycobacterium tuberculosis T46]EFD46806.1 conserved hypothetical protein [Mycobacterium tuberculosis T17]